LPVVLIRIDEIRQPVEEPGPIRPRIIPRRRFRPLGRHDQRTAEVQVDRHVEDLVRFEGADEAGLVDRVGVVDVDAQGLGLVDRLVAVGDGGILGAPHAGVRGDGSVDDAVIEAAAIVEEGVGGVAG
jgi:hypothetical protein